MTHSENEVIVADILGQFDDRRENLLAILQDIQATFFYLPEDALRRVARKLQVSLADVYQVATFYHCFSLKPRGKHLVQVCQGTACHVRGSERILKRVQTETGAGLAGTSPDMQFTVESVRCLGCCGLAPVARVDKDTYAHLEIGKVKNMLRKYRAARVEPRHQEPVLSGAHD
ncbi:MAG: NAD(P)H-dependent oxidoreductase subunit E [Terriglobales bacterium]